MKLTKKQLFAAGLAVAAFAGAGAAIAASRPTGKEEQKAVIDDARIDDVSSVGGQLIERAVMCCRRAPTQQASLGEQHRARAHRG